MKVLVARLNHETNTFSPVITDRDSFEPKLGHAAREEQIVGNTAMTAFLRYAEALPNARVVTPLSAMANPSGSVLVDAYDWLCDEILREASDTDLFLLDLHGAMVVEGGRDGEGELLARIRQAAPKAKIYVALDLHANVTQRMVDNVDAMLSFKTYPHVDMQETGAHLVRIVDSDLKGETHSLTAWHQLPLLSHTLRSNTQEGAMQRAVEAAKRAEQRPGVLAVSILAGFSLADFPDTGMSVVVVADGDIDLARRVANEIGNQIWSDREGFVYRSTSLCDSLRRAKQLSLDCAARPVLLLDHSDNVMSGGTCDTMDVLSAAISADMESIAVGPICDPAAVAQAISAGLGADLTLELGNHFRRPIRESSPNPLALRGRVVEISDGTFKVRGPIYTGATFSMGRSVAVDIGPATVVVTERRIEPLDLGVFECVGIDCTRYRFILLKSRMYCRPVFGPLCADIVECDSDIGGFTSADYRFFRFEKIRKPIFPL